MRATAILRAEHEHILRGLLILDLIASELDKGGTVPRNDVELLVGFLRHYADGLHHGKEEDVLFPALAGAGLPRNGGPVAVMLHEHECGRGFIRQMVEALPVFDEPAGRRSFASAAHSFAALLEQHIAKENAVLFRMADQLLASADDALIDGYTAREADARAVSGIKDTWEQQLATLFTRYSPKQPA